jgi:Ca2+-binding RTX toxin-like protein
VNGTAVGTVTGYDFDSAASLTYSLLDNAAGRFAINPSSGAITVANGVALDYESATAHQVRVRIADQSGHVFDKTFTIAVADIADGPSGAVLSGNGVAENAGNGTLAGIVIGFDSDPHAVLSYALIDNAGGRFAINPSTGAVILAGGPLDYETAHSHAITVRVTDQNGHTSDRTLAVNVTDVNEAPTGATLSANAVAENSPNGTVVGVVTGHDVDSGASLSYAMIDGAAGRFQINPATGVVTVVNGAALDYESAASHQVTVRTADQGGLSVDTTFTINVANINEAPTGATLSGNTVAENSPNGTVVGTVTAIDPDAGTVFRYSLQDNASGRFAIDPNSGQVLVSDSSHLDYEAASAHGIVVHAQDQGGLSVDRAFTIQIADVPGITLNGDGGANTLVGSPENDTINGFAGNDVLIGAVGNDRLDGGAGADAMLGGPGDDTYVVDNAGDAVTENAGEGADRVQSSISFTLTANVDNLTLADAAPIDGTGNAANNVIIGNSGNNVLTGLGGADAVDGAEGFRHRGLLRQSSRLRHLL